MSEPRVRMALRRHLAVGATSVVLALAAVLFSSAPASAHAVLLRTDPVENSIVQSGPSRVTLSFNERVSAVKSAWTVTGPSGSAVQAGGPTQHADGKELVQRLHPKLGKGTYLVNYRVISADGHPVAGSFTFSVKERSATPNAASDNGTGSSVDPAVRGALSLAKYLGYLGMVLLFGSVLMLLALWPRRLNHERLTLLSWLGATLVVAGALGLFVVQVPYGNGGSLTGVSGAGLGEVATSSVGVAYLARIGLVLLAVPLLWRLPRRPDFPSLQRWSLIALGVALTFTWPFAGHLAVAPGWVFAVVVGALHVGSMAVWLGGLVVLVSSLLPTARVSELKLILPVWSLWAMYAVVTLGVTGIVSALLEVSLHDVVHTQYGWLVIAKAVGLAAILGVAFFSRRWVRRRLPTLDESEERDASSNGVGIRTLRRRVGVEIGIAAIVLGLAMALSQTSPSPSTVEAVSSAQRNGPYNTELRASAYTVQLEVDPARRGNNQVHLIAVDSDGNPARVLEWHATAALPAQNVGPIDIPLLSITESHVVGEANLPREGSWRFQITLRVSAVDEYTATGTVPVP